ncbi:hypothetical protein RMATCC62417_05423 [Rhizopus microsporus]|nr:hypothetical protein RMATCC62417_05423 [Rhizopus microsporus]
MTKYRDEPIKRSNNTIIQWFGLDQFEPERAVSSNFVSSKTLFIIRLPLVLYSFVVLWIDIIWSIKTDQFRHFFAYFTDLTFIGLNAYLVTTQYHHAKYLWFTSSSSQRPNSFLDQAPVLNYLYVYLYHTIIVFNIQTPVVFWALLAQERLFNAHLSPIDFWISISLHAVTLFILVVEVIFNRMKVQRSMIFLVYGTVVFYMFLTFIIFAVEQWWVYSFLDWSVGPSAIIWYVAISLFIVICFFFQMGLHKARDIVANYIHGSTTVFTEKDRPDSAVVLQQTNFEPLASTIGGGSRITFGENNAEPSKASSIYY